MRRQDYELIASAIRPFARVREALGEDADAVAEAVVGAVSDTACSIARDLAATIEVKDPHFDRVRFLAACGVPRPAEESC